MGTTAEVLEKLRGLDGPILLALVEAFPGERAGVGEVLSKTKKIVLEDVIRLLVDRHSRCIPIKPEVSAAVCDANRKYYLDSLAADFTPGSAWLMRWQKLFNQSAELNESQFNERIAAVKAKVSSDSTVANLLSGPCFPVLLPQVKPDNGGYSAMLEECILPAAEKGYTEAFPDRRFVNYCKGELANQVTIVDKRHQKLVDDLTQGLVPGLICFPLQGFSVHAQRQMAGLMPEYISLCGPIEIGVAEAMYPKQLSRDINTPVKGCSAVQWQDPARSLSFDAYDGKLEFGTGYYLSCARALCSGALFLRG